MATKKHYYAHYCELGCKAVYAYNPEKYWGDYYAFPSKKARDEWLEKHEWDNYPNWTAREATRAEVISQLGKGFTISDYEPDFLDGAQPCKRKYEY